MEIANSVKEAINSVEKDAISIEKAAISVEEAANSIEEHTNINPQDQKIPKVGMKFDSEEDLYNYFKTYAFHTGFGIRKSSTRTKDSCAKTYYSLGCAKGGVYVPKTSKPYKKSSKTNCKAQISVIAYSDGRCVISSMFLEHNHALSPKKSRFQRSHKKMDSYAKRRLKLNDYARIPLNKFFHSLVVEAKGYENLPFGETDCRSYITKVRYLRLGLGDAKTLRNYFVCMQKRTSNFFYVIDIDDECRMRNIFWVDSRSRATYESFEDAISFDSTYLTNKYNMPFAPFVGVNHHGQSILSGCGCFHERIQKHMYGYSSHG
ncbi:protein FAR1-RELATED SEQUENCE 8-like [Lactuca sativa]|uniref:protein FAR1-RELATED SEQUENCE 8-like n=1 Tax=Lactuca sativa TaxID=4236 RepID=UPI000CD9163B|nr:protein FAR1-RELATED SEQUENCE 8-like [Lactuca sativa]